MTIFPRHISGHHLLAYSLDEQLGEARLLQHSVANLRAELVAMKNNLSNYDNALSELTDRTSTLGDICRDTAKSMDAFASG